MSDEDNILKPWRGFFYKDSDEQIREYQNLPAEAKLRWLDEVWRLSLMICPYDPELARTQALFGRGKSSS